MRMEFPAEIQIQTKVLSQMSQLIQILVFEVLWTTYQSVGRCVIVSKVMPAALAAS